MREKETPVKAKALIQLLHSGIESIKSESEICVVRKRNTQGKYKYLKNGHSYSNKVFVLGYFPPLLTDFGIFSHFFFTTGERSNVPAEVLRVIAEIEG